MRICIKCDKLTSKFTSKNVCKKCTNRRAAELYPRYRIKQLASQKRLRDQRVIKLLSLIAGGNIKCFCCGEKSIQFLAVDHINGLGSQIRRENYRLKDRVKLLDEVQQNWAKVLDYQILCHNCNWAKGKAPGRICPVHKEGAI